MRQLLLDTWYVVFAIAIMTMFPYMRAIGVGDIPRRMRWGRVLNVAGAVLAIITLVLAFTADPS